MKNNNNAAAIWADKHQNAKSVRAWNMKIATFIRKIRDLASKTAGKRNSPSWRPLQRWKVTIVWPCEVYNELLVQCAVCLCRGHINNCERLFFLSYTTSFSDGDFKWKLHVKQTPFSFYCKFIRVWFTCYLKKKVRRFYSENRSDVRYILVWECVKKQKHCFCWLT